LIDKKGAEMSYSAFVEARDFLLAHRTDYETAYRDFRWPQLTEFNWALDYFDVMAAGNDRRRCGWSTKTARNRRCRLPTCRRRSNQVANWLRQQGVKRGDRILMMLGNEVPLWDTMLASIKLGAVLSPATTLLAPTIWLTVSTAVRSAT
jgi:acetyl-CoA synthetase